MYSTLKNIQFKSDLKAMRVSQGFVYDLDIMILCIEISNSRRFEINIIWSMSLKDHLIRRIEWELIFDSTHMVTSWWLEIVGSLTAPLSKSSWIVLPKHNLKLILKSMSQQHHEPVLGLGFKSLLPQDLRPS